MILRTMKKHDYTQVDALLMQIHQLDLEERPDLFSPKAHYMTKSCFASLLDNENIFGVLAMERGRAVGACMVSLIAGEVLTAYVDLLVVERARRREGIGGALFREVRRRAGMRGAKRIELMVWSHNPIAEKAYRAYGMKPQRTIYEMNIETPLR